VSVAIVNILPDPVTPSSTCRFSPAAKPAISSPIACG
jgi:hypothetical protein